MLSLLRFTEAALTVTTQAGSFGKSCNDTANPTTASVGGHHKACKAAGSTRGTNQGSPWGERAVQSGVGWSGALATSNPPTRWTPS